MPTSDLTAGAGGIAYPAGGTIRVGVAPGRLPNPPRSEGDPERFSVGPNRLDDPYGRFVMRYTASTPRGCMVELLARFRVSPAAEAVLAAVEGVDDSEPYAHDQSPSQPDSPVSGTTPERAQALVEWLER